MRIVTRTQFLALPCNTLYFKYETGGDFHSLGIRDDACGTNDFFTQDLDDIVDASSSDDRQSTLDNAEATGASFATVINSSGRDGLFENDQLFAVWERDDLLKLQARIQDCLDAIPA